MDSTSERAPAPDALVRRAGRRGGELTDEQRTQREQILHRLAAIELVIRSYPSDASSGHVQIAIERLRAELLGRI